VLKAVVGSLPELPKAKGVVAQAEKNCIIYERYLLLHVLPNIHIIMGNSSSEYSLIALLHQPSINKGDDDVEIDIYVVGHGDVEKCQLFIVHSHPQLVASNFGTLKRRITTDEEESLEKRNIIKREEDLTNAGGHTPIDSDLFEELHYDQLLTQQLDLPVSYLETRHGTEAPLHYELPTASDASHGDYTITLLLTYVDGEGNIHQDREDVEVHVNTTREQWEPWPTRARIAGAIIAVGSLVITAYGTLPCG
jgi:hypothetical protein